MEAHALAFLKEAEKLEWPDGKHIQESRNRGGIYNPFTPQLLYHLIEESQALGGTVLDQFWKQVGKSDPKLKKNVRKLEAATPEQTLAVLFEGIDMNDIDFTPVHRMANEYFTHLGIAIMNPGGPKSEVGTSSAVSDFILMDTEQLLAVGDDDKSGQRRQLALECLAMKRDGVQCPVTRMSFRQPQDLDRTSKARPHLAHIIPISFLTKPDTLRCLTMFAGEKATNLVIERLDSPGNVMNLESNAQDSYDELAWGIEARKEDGKMKYIYRRVPFSPDVGPIFIRLKDGDEVPFGQGKDGERLEGGPLPLLCNIHLALARVLHMSGAAEMIMSIMEGADDSDIPHSYIACDESCDILASKLLLLHDIHSLQKSTY